MVGRREFQIGGAPILCHTTNNGGVSSAFMLGVGSVRVCVLDAALCGWPLPIAGRSTDVISSECAQEPLLAQRFALTANPVGLILHLGTCGTLLRLAHQRVRLVQIEHRPHLLPVLIQMVYRSFPHNALPIRRIQY